MKSFFFAVLVVLAFARGDELTSQLKKTNTALRQALKSLSADTEAAVGWTASEIEDIKMSGKHTFFIGDSGTSRAWFSPELLKYDQRNTVLTFDFDAFTDSGYMVGLLQEYKSCTGKETDLKDWAQKNIQRGMVSPNNEGECTVMCASYGKPGCCEWQWDHMACKHKTGSLQDNTGYDRFFKTGNRWSAMIENLHAVCDCSGGQANSAGNGGPNCSGYGNNGVPWCYVGMNSGCNDLKGDLSTNPWSEQACN